MQIARAHTSSSKTCQRSQGVQSTPAVGAACAHGPRWAAAASAASIRAPPMPIPPPKQYTRTTRRCRTPRRASTGRGRRQQRRDLVEESPWIFKRISSTAASKRRLPKERRRRGHDVECAATPARHELESAVIRHPDCQRVREGLLTESDRAFLHGVRC